MKCRNLNITPDAPVQLWGVEGIATAIDRGSYTDWKRIKAAIEANPYGTVALDTEQAIEIAESPGISSYLSLAIKRARKS